MAPTGDAYNSDWLFSTAYNVHVANNHKWFTTMTSFTSSLGTGSTANKSNMKVYGIGEVKLPIAPYEGDQPEKPTTIILHDVCFVPGASSNIIGLPLLEDYSIATDFRENTSSLIEAKTGSKVGIFDNAKSLRLRLAGQKATQNNPYHKEDDHVIRANLSKKEWARWHWCKGDRPTELVGNEKRWLKRRGGGEDRLLASCGLSIDKAEDRAEGRRIVREAVKAEEAEAASRGDDDGMSDSCDIVLR